MSKLTTNAADVSLDYASAADWPAWTDQGYYWTPTDAFEPTREDVREAAEVLRRPALLTAAEPAAIDARIATMTRPGDEYGERFPDLRRSMLARDVSEFLARSCGGHDSD